MNRRLIYYIVFACAATLALSLGGCNSDSKASAEPKAGESNVDDSNNGNTEETPKESYTLSYDANGADGTVPAAETYESGSLVDVEGQGSLAIVGSDFAGWNSASDGSGTAYHEGSQIQLVKDTTLYAQWSDVVYTVSFETEYDSALDQKVAYGNKASWPTTLVEDGMGFIGWYSDAAFEERYNFDEEVTQDITLYAKWESASELEKQFEFAYDDQYSGLKKYIGDDSEVEIPASMNGKALVIVMYTSFYSNDTVVKVVIPHSVEVIDAYAFYECQGLKDISIPDSVTDINDLAFAYCIALTSISLPKGIDVIDRSLFEGCESLKSIVIPESVTFIGRYSFANTALTTVAIPESVTTIEAAAFSNCEKLENFSVSELNTTYSAVDGILYSKDKTRLESWPSGKDDFVIPAGTTKIGVAAFYEEQDLVSLLLPDSVTTIGRLAFQGCENLTSADLGEGVSIIEGGAFLGCSKMTLFSLPATLITLGDNVFRDCEALKEIVVDGANTAFSANGGVLFSKDGTLLIHFPEAKGTNYTIPDGVTELGSSAFYGCENLTSVTLADSVTVIGSYTFVYCTSLTSIDASATHSEFKTVDGVLYSKDGTILVRWPHGKGSSFTVPEGVTKIESYAFNYSLSLTEVTLPSTLSEIGNSGFYQCDSLVKVTSYAVTPPAINSYATFDQSLYSCELYVPAGTKDAYSADKYWGHFFKAENTFEM